MNPAHDSAGPASSFQPGETADNDLPPATKKTSRPQPVYRPDDNRPAHDNAKLAQLGIHLYESKRLKLYTDIDPDVARTLPPVMDQAYDAWEAYFGPLPPNRAGTEYQMTGYIMADKRLFRETGLLPEDLPDFPHGRHRGAEFWMNDQQWDYYRRHLMIHEGTHCFMTTMPGAAAPVWYLEGMAELFGTHHLHDDGRVEFRVMPADRSAYTGFGRIELIQQDIEKTRYKTFGEIVGMLSNDFFTPNSYAWAWGLCEFFDSHPRYGERFRELGQHMHGSRFSPAFFRLFGAEITAIYTEWPLFASNLEYGYDAARAAIDFQTGKPLAAGTTAGPVDIAADRGWQSSGVLIEANRTYEVAADGQFTVAQEPKPWVSEADGVSIRYYRGRPVGRLVAAIRSEPPAGDDGVEPMLLSIDVGRRQSFIAPITGTLFLRINDHWSELADNDGKLTVHIRAISPGSDR